MVRCVTTEKLFYDAYSYTFGHTDRKSALEVLPHRQKKKFSSSYFTTFLTMKRKIRAEFSSEILFLRLSDMIQQADVFDNKNNKSQKGQLFNNTKSY